MSRKANEPSALDLMKKWGFLLQDKPHRSSPGYGRLLVAIRPWPTRKHYDPRALHLSMRDSDGYLRRETLSWLNPTPDQDRVCLGRIILTDRLGEHQEFFSFGGSLAMNSGPEEKVYSLTSPAPILNLTEESETIPDQLAAEAEALAARIEAEWIPDDVGFSCRLAELGPLRLYLATVQSTLAAYDHDHAFQQAYGALCDALRQEKARLAAEGLWPDQPYGLEDLLTRD